MANHHNCESFSAADEVVRLSKGAVNVVKVETPNLFPTLTGLSIMSNFHQSAQMKHLPGDLIR
jgi:hypothetical protein